MPPGHPGDVRPGYWQGNKVGPRSFGTGALAFLVFNIPANDPIPWAHVYLPRANFDTVREENNWIFLRKGDGYAALWLPSGYSTTDKGIWANSELKLNSPRAAVLSFIGNAARHGNFDNFIARARALQPQWNVETLTLSALSDEKDAAPTERISVSYESGPSRGGQKIETRGARFQTPWGNMKLGSMTVRLHTPAGDYDLDLRSALN
jgi:hypothetical protein